MTVEAAILVLRRCGKDALELTASEAVGGNGAGSNRLLHAIGGIGRQPAIADAESKEGTQALVPAPSGEGVAIPTAAELLELRRSHCIQAEEFGVLRTREENASRIEPARA